MNTSVFISNLESRMNDILDDDLTKKKPTKSLYGKYSNLPAALVILGALFKIMHWPYGNVMLLVGICAHFGIELGYALVLRFKSNINNRRLMIATFFFVMMSGFWRVRWETLSWIDGVYGLIVLASIAITYYSVKKKGKGSIL